MFYEWQPETQRNNYKKMLSIVGNLSQLFSESDCPYLAYRAHENVFCKYFHAENLARQDCSADAKKANIGIGLKTWMGNNDQKVAEFGKLRETFAGLSGMDLVRTIAEYRNERIRVTKNLHGIETMIYHIVRRVPRAMEILEHSFDYIDLENITLIENRGNANNTYFTDGHHTYHFNASKTTLYMIFEDMELLDSFEVEIMDDPYSFLMRLMYGENVTEPLPPVEEFLKLPEPTKLPQLCLRLYSLNRSTKEKIVPQKSGLNQWNAGGRVRTSNEVYIPYNKEDRQRAPDFFPPRDTDFNLRLPDGKILSAKVCQDAYKRMSDEKYETLTAEEKLAEDYRRNQGKAIFSNPNNDLGEWLLRKVFELPEGTLVTYEMLQRYGIDSVVFTKHGDLDYSVDFAEIGTYEAFYETKQPEIEEET